jgi:hypothetical protein
VFGLKGHVQPKDENGTPGKELMVFKWQPGSMKKTALAPFEAKKETSVEDDIAELRKQVAQLQKDVGNTTGAASI